MLATQKFKRVNNRLRDFSMETVVCRSFWFIQFNTVRDDTQLKWDKDEMDFLGPVKYHSIYKRNIDLFSAYDTYSSVVLDKSLSTSNLFSPANAPPLAGADAGVINKIKRRY